MSSNAPKWNGLGLIQNLYVMTNRFKSIHEKSSLTWLLDHNHGILVKICHLYFSTN